MADVRTFPGVKDPEAPRELQPVDRVVKILEDLLERAQKGELRALAVAMVNYDDSLASLWAKPEGGDHWHQLTAAIAYLQARYVQDVIERSTDITDDSGT